MGKSTQILGPRFQFLHQLYKESNAATDALINSYDIGEIMGLAPQETDRICDYLAQEGFIDIFYGGNISMTHKGIVEVETAQSKLKNQGENSRKVVNIINAKKIVNSSVKQGEDNSNIISHWDNNKIIWHIIVPIGVAIAAGIIVWWVTK